MPLNIPVTTDYKITSDTMQFIVSKRHIVDPTKSPRWPELEAKGADPTPREVWKEATYHSTIEQALKWIVSQRTRESDAASMSELLSEIKRFNDDIRAAMI